MGTTHRPSTKPPSTKFRRQSPELMRQRFLWLDQVLIDPELPASAFKVAYRIGQGFNDRDFDGKAYEACVKIATAIGMSEKTVITMARRLHARGHLRVEWGRQGSGHPNNYWLILKPASAQVSDEEIKPASTPRKPASGKIKPASTPIKPAPTQESHSTSQRKSHGGSHTARVAAPDFSFSPESKQACSAAVATEGSDPPAAGFKEFWAVYPKPVGKPAAEREYKRALQKGATAEEINAGARRYAVDPERIERGDRFTKDPHNWLKEGRWVDKPTGVTIDEHGNAVPAARPWRNGRDSGPMAVAARLIATGRFSNRRAS